LDCGGKRSATRLFLRSESGVALRLPPQSKITWLIRSSRFEFSGLPHDFKRSISEIKDFRGE